ncbi:MULTISPECIES: putative capsular polysaccharide synthesis family protein [Paraliobacillus]|uniref:putative capsular polysaccharide synthesis family protein n=1 Tax=Paraliobacillus TaxID=200903 RepID=UPI0013003F13|nr:MULTISPECIES: putative capsular polysaccharide synthesis family protein [Paraliobacillus]
MTKRKVYDHLTSVDTIIEDIKENQVLPLMVFQMGKVGSSTIKKSLGKYLESNIPIWHVHHLKNKMRASVYYEEGISLAEMMHKSLDESNKDQKLKVITLVRDPISRNISHFFQVIDRLVPDTYESYIKDEKPISDLHNAFFYEEYHKKGFHQVPLNWFDNEIKSIFHIDLLEEDFPKDKGYKIYQYDKVEILLLKLEDIQDTVKDAFKEFMDFKNFELKNANTSSDKEYTDLYKKFKSTIHIPETYKEEMYNSKLVKHFYKEDEIKKLQKRWNKSYKSSIGK